MSQKNFADAMNQIVNSTPNGLKAQINEKAGKNSPAFTGTPTAPTPDNDTDSTQIATTEFCQNLIRRLVGAAPETLNTLVELATAINNDPNFAQTIVQALDGKLNKTDAANTYATKSELSNVSVDTSNLAKLNQPNTFTQEQTIGGFTIGTGPGGTQIKNNNVILQMTSTGNFMFCIDTAGQDGFYYRNTDNLIMIGSKGVTYNFQSDGIYLGSTKITN